jgi:hypothetical protein
MSRINYNYIKQIAFTSLVLLFSISMASSQTLSPYQLRSIEALKLELEIIQVTSSTVTKEALRSRVLGIYERLVENYCFPGLDVNPTLLTAVSSSDCQFYKTKLEEILPESPVLVCVKFGIGAPECAQAYEQQYVMERAIEKNPDTADLDAKIADLNNKPKREELNREIITALDKFNTEKTHENGEVVAGLLDRLIGLDCAFIKIRAELTPPDERNRASRIFQPKAAKGDPINDLYASLESKIKGTTNQESPQATPANVAGGESSFSEERIGDAPNEKPVPLYRVRYFTPNCFKALKTAHDFDPRYPTGVCFLQGMTAPPCIQSKLWLRDTKTAIEQKKRQLEQPAVDNSTGLETF